jgi:hypothetical protein
MAAAEPHRPETFKLSTDPLFVEKGCDIIGLYLNPPERAVVHCVDEKSQTHALDRTQPLMAMRPSQVERHTHDYRRPGTCPFSGKRRQKR